MTSIRSRAPKSTSVAVRRVMQANVGRETGIERALRRSVHARGLRYRKNVRPEKDIRCEADLVFAGSKVCVFVDGCYWHGCPKHFAAPMTNRAWWQEKIQGNVDRDDEVSGRSQIDVYPESLLLLRDWNSCQPAQSDEFSLKIRVHPDRIEDKRILLPGLVR